MAAIFEIVCQGFTLTAIPQSGGIGSPDSFPPPTGVVSTKVTLDAAGKGALLDTISWTAVGCTMPGATFVSGGGSMTAQTLYCTSDGQKFFLKLDMGDCSGSFITNSSPSAQIMCSCKIMIKDAGQTRVKGS